MSDVLYEVKDGIATLTLNRPDRLNAMGGDMLPQALAAIEKAAADENARVVVLTGAGRGFCVGGDLSEGAGGGFGGDNPIDSQVRQLREKSVFRLGHSIPDGAAEIARLADECLQARQERELRDQAND